MVEAGRHRRRRRGWILVIGCNTHGLPDPTSMDPTAMCTSTDTLSIFDPTQPQSFKDLGYKAAIPSEYQHIGIHLVYAIKWEIQSSPRCR